VTAKAAIRVWTSFSGASRGFWVKAVNLFPHKDVRMAATITLEVPVEHEALDATHVGICEELHQLALDAPDGTVFDACESAVIRKGREVQTQMLEAAVARRIEAAEKKGADPCLLVRPCQGEPRPKARQFVSAIGR